MTDIPDTHVCDDIEASLYRLTPEVVRARIAELESQAQFWRVLLAGLEPAHVSVSRKNGRRSHGEPARMVEQFLETAGEATANEVTQGTGLNYTTVYKVLKRNSSVFSREPGSMKYRLNGHEQNGAE